MTRHRKKTSKPESVFEMLVDLPWQVSVVLSVAAFIFMRWIFPAMISSRSSSPLAIFSSAIAPLFSGFLLFLGVISFLRHQAKSPNIYPVNWNPKSVPRAYFRQEPGFELQQTSTSDSLSVKTISPSMLADLAPPTSPPPPKIQKAWSLELLRLLEWKRFEIVCAEYFRLLGKKVETTSHGADGGLDIRVYGDDPSKLELGIQCKAWGNMVGVNIVRELLGVITHESAGKGILMTTGSFSKDAKSLALQQSEKLLLVDGESFITMIGKLDNEYSQLLLEIATEGDYTTPTCASCGEKMIRKTGRNGDFWACKKFPRLHSTLHLRKQDKLSPSGQAT